MRTMTQRQTRIVQVLLSPRIGGAETLAASLETEWQAQGHSCSTLYLDPSDDRQDRHVRFLRLWKALRECNPRYIVAHSTIPAIYARAARPSRSEVTTVLHSAVDDFRNIEFRIAEKALRGRTAHVIAVSPKQRDTYVARFPDSDVAVIPNGISQAFAPRSAPLPPPIGAVTVARVALQKRPDFWCDVVQLARSEQLPLRFQWWGPVAPGLESTRDRMISLNGWMGPTANPLNAYLANQILFHTALEEAHSVTLLEAAATGIPIVCSEEVGDTLGDEIPRFTYRGHSPADAVATLKRVIDSWPNVSEAANRAARTVSRRYSMSRCATDYLRIIAGSESW